MSTKHTRTRLRVAAVLTAAGLLGAPAAAQAAIYPGPNGNQDVHGAIYDQPDGSADPGVNPGQPVSVSGAFYPYWAANGYERGRLGWPLGEELNGDDPFYHATQVFQGGALYWAACTGVTEDTTVAPACG